jgi:hypothetical protein
MIISIATWQIRFPAPKNAMWCECVTSDGYFRVLLDHKSVAAFLEHGILPVVFEHEGMVVPDEELLRKVTGQAIDEAAFKPLADLRDAIRARHQARGFLDDVLAELELSQ